MSHKLLKRTEPRSSRVDAEDLNAGRRGHRDGVPAPFWASSRLYPPVLDARFGKALLDDLQQDLFALVVVPLNVGVALAPSESSIAAETQEQLALITHELE